MATPYRASCSSCILKTRKMGRLRLLSPWHSNNAILEDGRCVGVTEYVTGRTKYDGRRRATTSSVVYHLHQCIEYMVTIEKGGTASRV